MEYRLEEIYNLQMGKTPSRNNLDYWNTTDNKWISIADLSKCGKYIENTKEYLSNQAVEESGISQIPANTVVMSFKLSIGKTAITSEPMYSNEAIMSFRDKMVTDILPDYIYYLFFNRDWSEGTNKAVMGKTLNKATLSKIKVNIPDMKSQQKVVEVLDKVNNIIDARKSELKELNKLIKARFVEMFGNGTHEIVKASEVCDFITKGTTPPTGEITEVYEEEKVPFLKVYNLSFTGEMLFDDNPQYISKETHNGKLVRSKVYPNDVLMNIVGPPLGKFTLVTDEFDEWNINQAIAIFRAKERILPRFLLHALMQPKVLEPFIGQAVGIRQQNLSLEQCRNLQFPLPSLEEQKAFVEFAEQVDKSKVAVQINKDTTQELLIIYIINIYCYKYTAPDLKNIKITIAKYTHIWYESIITSNVRVQNMEVYMSRKVI